MMTLITINRVYYLIGFVVMLLVVMTLRDRANPKRFTTALFWFLFGGIFLFGDLMVQELGKSLAYRIIGGGVIAIALLAPMAEGAALNEYGELPQHIRDKIKAHAAACDNIAVFFGEDIFIAFGAVLLIDAFLKENGIPGIEPLHIGLWAIPTAIAALIIHMTRLLRLDASIRRDVMAWRAEQGTQEAAQ